MTDSLLRRVWRWHFWAGLLACPVLLVVSVTGALYVFREEIEDWQQADVRFVEPVGVRKPVSEQLAAVKAAHPDWVPTRVSLPADLRKSTVVQVERPDVERGAMSAVFVNPYVGEVIAAGDVRSPFFSGVLKLHRSLFAGTFGRVVVELTTSWVLVLLVTGVCLWLPRRWNRLRGVWVPRLRSKPYVVLRDLHALSGLYLVPVIAVVAATGLFFSLVWLWSFNHATGGAGNFPQAMRPTPVVSESELETGLFAIDAAACHGRERFPNDALTIQPPQKPMEGFQVTARGIASSVTGWIGVDRETGAVHKEARAEDRPVAEQARLYVLPLHTGSVGGWPTKVLALVACVVLAWLGLSGVWMWLTRRLPGRSGFPSRADVRVPKPAVVAILLLATCLPTVGLSLLIVLCGEWITGRLRRPTSLTSPTDVPAPVLVGGNENGRTENQEGG